MVGPPARDYDREAAQHMAKVGPGRYVTGLFVFSGMSHFTTSNYFGETWKREEMPKHIAAALRQGAYVVRLTAHDTVQPPEGAAGFHRKPKGRGRGRGR